MTYGSLLFTLKLFETASSRAESSVVFWISLVAVNTIAGGIELRNVRLGDIDLRNQTLAVRVGKNAVPVNKTEALAASASFETSEGIDLDPAATVAFASLLEASGNGLIAPNSTVVLNISGGRKRRLASAATLFPNAPDLTIHTTAVTASVMAAPKWIAILDREKAA